MGLTVQRVLQGVQRVLDGNRITTDPRGNGYSDQMVVPVNQKMYPLCEEGNYYVITNPTPGTGVAGHAAPTTLDNTKPFLIFRNSDPVGGRKIYLDFIKLTVTAAGTAGSLNYATHLLDAGAGYSSGGTAISPVQPNGELPVSCPIDNANIGPCVATANASLQRVVGHQAVRTVIPVVGDVYLFSFGGISPAGTNAPTEGTLQVDRLIHCAPVIVAPGQFYKMVLWRASQSGASSYELEMGLWVR